MYMYRTKYIIISQTSFKHTFHCRDRQISSTDKNEYFFGLSFFQCACQKFQSMPHLLSYDEWRDEPFFERRKFFGKQTMTTFWSPHLSIMQLSVIITVQMHFIIKTSNIFICYLYYMAWRVIRLKLFLNCCHLQMISDFL